MNMDGSEYEVVKLEKKEGIFTPENGRDIPYCNWYIHFKRTDSPLIMRAKVDKVFNDYVEDGGASAE